MKISKNIEELKRIKKLLIVVDMINGFVNSGALAHKEVAEIIPENKKLIEYFVEDADSAVCFVRDSHTEDAMEFNTFPKHCLENSYESMLVDELLEYEEHSLSYKKNSTSFVFAPGFIEDIRSMINLEEVILNGCLTDYCIKNGAIALKNLFDQEDRNIKIIIDEAGVSTFEAEGHNREEETILALNDMRNNGLVLVNNYGENL